MLRFRRMSLTEPRPRHRILGFDIIRLLSFVAISLHHFSWVIWYSEVPFEHKEPIWTALSAYARSLSFSGHSILFLSCYLIAKSETRTAKTWKVIALVAFGWLAFCLFERGQNPVFWIWDIYPLIVVGLLTSMLVTRSSLRFGYVLGFVGFFMTWIEFWKWTMFDGLSLQWRHWLVGDCSVDLADWPILPWIGIMWVSYAIGTWDREKTKVIGRSAFAILRKAEWVVWPLLLLGAIPQLGAFYHITLGPKFACFSFRQTPLVFWSHFIFVVFALRVSLLDRVQAWLEKWRVARAIGTLRLSQSFGVAYLVHYTLIESAQNLFGPAIATSLSLSVIGALSILPLTELLVRAIEAVMNRRRNSLSKPSA